MNLFTKQIQTHRLTEGTCGCQGERWGNRIVWDRQTHTAVFKMDNQQLYSTENSTQCYAAAWMEGEFWGEWIYVSVWPSPFAVHLKLSQHC